VEKVVLLWKKTRFLPDPVSEVRTSGTISCLSTFSFPIARDFIAFFSMPNSCIFPKVT